MKPFLLTALFLTLAGCGSLQFRSEPDQAHVEGIRHKTLRKNPLTADEIKSLWRRETNGYVLTFKAEPEYPQAGQPATLEIALLKKGAPVSKAAVGCRTHVPELSGHTHFSTSRLSFTETAPGVYRAATIFPKKGEWEADFNILLREGGSIGSDFVVMVDSAK
jgi:hypothetical protein